MRIEPPANQLRVIGAAIAAAAVLIFGGWLVWTSVRFGVQESQDIRQQASVNEEILVRYGPLRPTTISPGEEASVDIQVNTQGTGISALRVSPVNTGISRSQYSFQNLVPDGMRPGWHLVGRQGSDAVFVDFVQFSDPEAASLFSSSEFVSIGRLRFAPTETTDISLGWFQDRLDVTSYQVPGVRVVPSQQRTETITVVEPGQGGQGTTETSSSQSTKKDCDANCATDTECRSEFICYEGRCRLPDDTGDAECEGEPDRGLNRACNQYCADSRECTAGLTCYYNFCRNPLNVENEQCQLPPTPSSAATTSKTTGTGGSQLAQAEPTPTPVVSPSPTSTFTFDFESATPSETELPAIESTPAADVEDEIQATAAADFEDTPDFDEAPEPTFVPIPEDVTADAQQGGRGLTPLRMVGLGIAVALLGGAVYALYWVWKNR